MGLTQRSSWLSFSAVVILLASCGAQPAPENQRPTEVVVRETSEDGIIPLREIDAEGRMRVRRVHQDEFLNELQVRVFQLKQIQPPQVDPTIPGATRIEDWEFYAVVDAFLTRDIRGRRLGKLDCDVQTACFIVRDTALVLGRIEALLRGIGDNSMSDALKEMLRAREEKEEDDFAVLRGLPKPDRKVREQGHLNLGQLPDLLRKAHDALAAPLKAGQSQREALSRPLVELKDEIDRIQGNPAVPREKQRRYY